MITEDGAFLESVGFRGRYEGQEHLRNFFVFVPKLYPDMELHDTEIVCEQADGKVVAAEHQFMSRSTKAGRLIDQLFVGRLEQERCKIRLLRESIGLVEVGGDIYANGLADLKLPEKDLTG